MFRTSAMGVSCTVSYVMATFSDFARKLRSLIEEMMTLFPTLASLSYSRLTCWAQMRFASCLTRLFFDQMSGENGATPGAGPNDEVFARVWSMNSAAPVAIPASPDYRCMARASIDRVGLCTYPGRNFPALTS